MARKRTKPWWQLLRGPRGHRGLPGPTGASSNVAMIAQLNHDVAALERRFDELAALVRDLQQAWNERTPTPEAAIKKMEGSQK